MKYVTALTIAGSDCSGGAGIQADVKTMSALGVYASSVVTAVTAQNCGGVTAVHVVPPHVISSQIEAVMTEVRPIAIKIGMVNDAKSMTAIYEALSRFVFSHLVVDPVMVSSSGSCLMQTEALETFKRTLLPMSTLLTPNLPEMEILTGIRISNRESLDLALRLLSNICPNILVKGGHIDSDESCDILLYNNNVYEFSAQRVHTINDHGTGCTLSAAIASFLALGLAMPEACSSAKEYLTKALINGADVEFGLRGHCAMNHFYNPQKMKKI